METSRGAEMSAVKTVPGSGNSPWEGPEAQKTLKETSSAEMEHQRSLTEGLLEIRVGVQRDSRNVGFA